MTKFDWLITATPPTPNGDLHVGHMSGPYLAAEIYRAARARLGDSAVYVCYGDDNQSYVVTTAERLGEDPTKLMKDGNDSIKKTLDAYGIEMDAYARPDSAHFAVVAQTIDDLIEKNLIVEAAFPQLYDRKSGAALYEAFVDGLCNKCLLSTKGGICESCGHPNDPSELLDQSGKSLSAIHECRNDRRLVLRIEDYREELIEFYRHKRGKWRPHLIHLVDELLSQPLADYPISHKGSWGIPVGNPNWSGHVINVWAEMGIGLVSSLAKFRDQGEMARGRYVQFLGYDNSYFFAIVHPVLQFALRRLGRENIVLPEYIFTNEFYNLENRKFSTSQGHAVWGRDLLTHISADEARFYLSLHGPELAESNFELDAALINIKQELRKPFDTLLAKIETISVAAFSGTQAGDPIVDRFSHRMQHFSEPEHFSSRELARLVSNGLAFLADFDLGTGNAESERRFVEFLGFWIECYRIFCPDNAKDARNALIQAQQASQPEPVS